MKTIQLEKSYPGDYKGKRLTDEDYDVCLTESTRVLKPDGSLLCVFMKRAIPMPMVAETWKKIRNWNPKTENRGTASGVEMVRRKKKDGTISNTNRVPKGYEVTSGVIGFFDRYPRIPYCRKCSWNQDSPEAYEAMLPFFQKVSQLHQELDPEIRKN